MGVPQDVSQDDKIFPLQIMLFLFQALYSRAAIEKG
jgi:hypothetical protein